MSNKIIVYEANTCSVACAVYNTDGTDANLSGFAATFTVKPDKETSTPATFTLTGTIVDNDITFDLSAADNTLSAGTYYYEVTITSTTEDYTLVLDRYIIKQSLVYIT